MLVQNGTGVQGPGLAVRQHLFALSQRLLGPMRLDVREDRAYLVSRKLAPERRHVTLIAVPSKRRNHAILNDQKKPLVRVLPRMPGVIVWRRRHPAVRKLVFPVRLPFQLCAVAGRAVFRIELDNGRV